MRRNRAVREITALLFFALVLGGVPVARADDAASATAPPPAVYQEKLAKLLTPLDDVLKKKSEYSRLKGDAIVLLDETVTYVAEDGKRVSVYHSVYQALNEAGVKAMAQDTFTYKKKIQRAYLVLGQTIQPDGTKDPVKSDAIFIKTPQDEADDSIYNDDLSLVSVYSDVKPGSITENITVLQDDEPRVPGQYSQTYTWNSSWPEYLQRLVVDLPKVFADRLKVTNLGQGVPDPVITHPDPDRQHMTWERLNTPADNEDTTEAPSDQIGPLVWLSTLPSWDAFASWYDGELKGTDVIAPELKAKIDAWTKDAKSPEEVLRILHGHVARDVRYTAFELGKSDLQPHESMSVWQRQYGDCKDKANLLRAMLATKGIDSWLTLLDTEHAGAVNKANPDFRQFDHCIVNAKIGDKTLFCDPTISYGAAGVLSGSDADRDVLVIKDGHADWERTPPFHDAGLTYTFDLKLRPNGELAGWVELKATGYYSAMYEEKYRALAKDQVLTTIEQDVQSFYPNSTVADVVPLKDPVPAGQITGDGLPPFTVRAYMTLTGVLNQGDGPSELKFPSPDTLLPSITDYKNRKHTTYLWPDFEQVTAKIQLPAGWRAETLPSPLHYDSASANFTASWSVEKDTLTADCQTTLKHSLFPTDEWETLGDTITNLQSWASKSVSLVRAKDGDATPAAAAPTDAQLAADLPVMPTGEGELNLIDSEFPTDGNLTARRAALERIPTLFPSDQKSIVEAEIKLAALDLDDEKWPEVISRLQPAEDANRAVLDPDTLAWADYVIACALDGEKKKDEARALFQKIADNTDVDSGRRGWAIYRTAKFMVAQSPAAALDYADKGLPLDSAAIPSLYAFYASTAASNKLDDRLKDRLTKLITAKPENLQDILTEIVNSASDLIDAGHKAEGLDLLAVLDSVSDPATTGETVAKAIKKVRAGADAMSVYGKIQDELKQVLVEFPEIAALEKKQPKFASPGDVTQAIQQHEDNREPTDALGCAFRVATGYPVDERFAEYFWDCVREADWNQRNSTTPPYGALFDKLALLGDELPHTSDGFADTKLLQAQTLQQRGNRAEAAEIYDALAKQTDLAEGYGGAVALRGGTNQEELGDYAKAVACYLLAEKVVDTETKAREAVLRAAFIQFDNGNKTEALRLVNVLADSARKAKIKTGEQVENVIELVKAPTTPPPFWDNWTLWWPQWQKLEAAGGLDPVKDTKIVPIIPSLLDYGKDLGAARNAKDTKHAFELLRQIAYAARFYPNAAQEFVGVFSIGEELLPDHANDFRLLAIAMLEPMAPLDPANQRTRVLDLMMNYVDTNQDDKALGVIAHEWRPENEDASSVTMAIHRVWGVAAIRQHQDLDNVAAALESDLKAPPQPDRVRSVGVLSDVYVALGRKDDAAKLIQAELANPTMADATVQQDLKTRLDNIQNTSQASKQLADGVAAWLKDHQPAWWDYAEPKSNADPRLARLDEILKKPDGEFQPAELVKAGLLSPTVTTLSPETQQQAVLKAFTTLLDSIATQDDANAFAHTILDSTLFPTSLKSSFLYFFLLDAYEKHQPGAFDTFAKLPLYQSLPDRQKDVMNRLGAYLKIDPTSSPAQTAYVQNLAQHPMDSLDLAVTQDAVAALLQSGDVTSAEAIYHDAANFTLTSDAGRTKPEFQLTLLKEINRLKQLSPVSDAMRKLVLAANKPDAITKPAAFDQRRNLITFGDLTEQEATQYRIYLIKTHQEHPSLVFWYDLMHDQRHDDAGYQLNLALLKAGFDNAADDESRAALVRFGDGVIDIDNPALRKSFLDLLQPYRDPAKFPQTAEYIRMYDDVVALRTGANLNLETDLGGFTSDSAANEAAHLRIRALLQTGDTGRLKSLLNALSADQLTSPALLSVTVPALEAVGMKDEAALARDSLAQTLHHDVLRVWFSGDGIELQGVGQKMNGLGSTQEVPVEFSSFVQSHIARQQDSLNYQLYKAYLEKDWPTTAAVGAKCTQAYADEYTAYWFLGRSLSELGKKDDAVKALTVYCRYSKDELWYPDAKALLAKLGGASP